MTKRILRVAHRHSDQKKGARDLVIEVGQPVPSFYQAGRPPNVRVVSIDGADPVVCTLENGDQIYIGGRSVCDVTWGDTNA